MSLARFPRRVLAPSALALVFVTLTAAVTLGVRVPSLGLLAPFPGLTRLDYGEAPFRGFAPLAPRFIRDVLGNVLAVPGLPGGSSSGPGGFSPSERGDFERVIQTHALNNDDVRDARRIPSVPFTARTDTRQASRAAGEPDDCRSLGGTVWYSFTPDRDVGLIANTFGSDYAVTLGMFTGPIGNFRSEGCDTDPRGNSILAFPAKRGVTYFFQIAGAVAGGSLVFNLEPQGTTRLESVSPSGEPGNRSSGGPSISGDGRWLAFESTATNLIPGLDDRPCAVRDPGPGLAYLASPLLRGESPCQQSIVRDRITGLMTLASVSSAGDPGHGHSFSTVISGDGRFVAFISAADNLVDGDTNESIDVFVRDLLTRRTERVSVSSSGSQLDDIDGEAGAESPSISDDGRYVVFESVASNLVPRDRNGGPDVFVRDRATGTTTRVSVSSDGKESEPVGSMQDNAGRFLRPGLASALQSATPCISPDARYVAFRSSASNLVLGDTNGVADTFVHDRLTRRTVRVSVSSSGLQADGESSVNPRAGRCISADGRYVTFGSWASNLVAGDTNSVDDVFVHDRLRHTTIRVSVSSSGQETSTGGLSATMSADGRFVAFHAPPTPTGGSITVYLHDLATRTTTRVSVTTTGEPTDGDSGFPALSRDARVVAFDSSTLGFISSAILNVYTHERPRSSR